MEFWPETQRIETEDLGEPANPGFTWKMVVKMVCVSVCSSFPSAAS